MQTEVLMTKYVGSVGRVIALIVLIVAIVLALIGKLPLIDAGFFIALALAILL